MTVSSKYVTFVEINQIVNKLTLSKCHIALLVKIKDRQYLYLRIFMSEYFTCSAKINDNIYRVTWSTEFVWGVVVGRGQFLKVLCMESPQTRVWLNWNFNAARGLLLRKELGGNWVVLRFSTLTGSMRYAFWSLCLFNVLYSIRNQGL